MVNSTAPPVPFNLSAAYLRVLLRLPPLLNCSVGSNSRATPEKDFSNSSMESAIFPLSGSLIKALPLEKPSNTTKWLYSQKIMHGKEPSSLIEEGEYLNPPASRPYFLAAIRMFLAFEPSLDTPQSIRSCSSVTHLP